MSNELDTTLCKGCGKPIVWGVTVDGKRISLDPHVCACKPDCKAVTSTSEGDEMTEKEPVVFLSPAVVTLRDYFAAMAMQSMISGGDVSFPYLLTAENAYLQSDMMLCVRDRQ